MKKLLVFALVFLFILPSFVRAQAEVETTFRYIATVIFGFPETWKINDFIWYGLIPFLGAGLIMYGFLSLIRIFGAGRNRLYGALSFFIIFATLPLGWFAMFVATIFQFMGTFSLVMFFVMFIIGIIFAVWRGIWRGYKSVGIEKKALTNLDQELGKVDNAIKKAYDKLKDPNIDENEKKKIISNVATLNAQRKRIIQSMGDVARI